MTYPHTFVPQASERWPQDLSGRRSRPVRSAETALEDTGILAKPAAVMERPAGFAGVAAGAVAGLLLLGAWGIVALSIWVVLRVAQSAGLSVAAAGVLAAPALAVPLWKTLGVMRQRSLPGALLAQLWVLNGSAGWAVVALGGLWWIGAVQAAFHGSRAGLLAALLGGGFVPLFGALVAVNWWLVSRRR